MDKRFWAIIGIIVAVFVGFLIFNGGDEETPGSTAKATNHVKGKIDSKVKLVEYGDFQCPVCGQYYPLVEQVVDKYKEQISFRFAHLPITQIHPNAYAAARAAEAAGNQGKFFEMYAQLFQNQQTWSSATDAPGVFAGYASGIGLDVKKFSKDAASDEVNARVRADRTEFNKTKLAVQTPTFLLNGKNIKATTLEEFSKLIDAELKKKGIDPPAATAETETTPAPTQ